MPVIQKEREPDRRPLPGENPASAHPDRHHNKPPLEEVIPIEFKEELLRERPDFLDVMNRYIAAADRATATDDETLGRCGDLVKGYRACLAHIDATHRTVKEPYLKGGRLVDAERKALAERVEEAKRRVEKIGDDFVAKRDAERKAEQERIAAEQRAAAEKAAEAERQRLAAEAEAERLRQEAASEEDRLAAEKAAEEARAKAEEAMSAAPLAAATRDDDRLVRSDAGATVGGKQEWQSQVTDYEVAFIHVSDNPRVREAIDKAIASLVRAGKRKLDGVRIWPVAKANFR